MTPLGSPSRRMGNIEDQAKIWARSWKPEIQRYIHGYRTVTGVDLAADITDTRDAATRYRNLRCCSSRGSRNRCRRCRFHLRAVLTSSRRECRARPHCPGPAGLNCPLTGRKSKARRLRSCSTSHPCSTWLSSCPPHAAAMGAAHNRPAGGARTGAGGRGRGTGPGTAAALRTGDARAPLTLHLYLDLFDVLARHHIAIYADAGTYPIARWGIERMAAKGVRTATFQMHDPAALEDLLHRDRGSGCVRWS